MTLLPPDLAVPFSGADERRRAQQQLNDRAAKLLAMESLAATPQAGWSQEQLDFFPPNLNGIPDPPPGRLRRWASLFAEELTMFHELVQRSAPLSDLELREAVYLAGRLLAPVLGVHLDEVDTRHLPWR